MLQTNATPAPQTAARMAEHGDTRMALQRREDEGRRQQGRARKEQDSLLNDETHVSVEALSLFIDNLLLRHDPSEALGAPGGTQPVIIRQQTEAANYASPAAVAARAYASASRTQGKRAAQPVPAMEEAIIMQGATAARKAAPSLSGLEKDQIAAIRENIALLKIRKVEELSIQRGETFLSSILESTARVLHSHSL